MKVYRYEKNPIIKPQDVRPYIDGFQVIGTFNAGTARYKDETILLLRVAEKPINNNPEKIKAAYMNPETNKIEVREFDKKDKNYDFSDSRVIKDNIKKDGSFKYLTSISYIRIARSKDGKQFSVEDFPFIFPEGELEAFGIEDPRVSQIGDVYYIYFSGVSKFGIGEVMIKTKDFRNKENCGMIFSPENKDVVIFPEKINGKYYALNRPASKSVGDPEIWISESDNLLYWGNHKHLIGLRKNKWDNGRIGAGAVPIKTSKGWLELYHGADKSDKYCIGALLLDLNDPSKIIARCNNPILAPRMNYETDGFFGNVVFTCGAICEDNIIKLYYGVSDTSMAYAEFHLEDVLNFINVN
ncbi:MULTISPECIES: BtaManbiosPhlase [Clostridium]|uniref:BtaManbiosPhlase n=1 Tax=Clostridium TaxID=1485 RepID=UPI00069D32D2|nr:MULTISPECIES: glycoside hydrolase family 130 protein [Clostridium]KOF56433.1 glycosidase [Clostridium sp. DMHC 10]MCD2347942.1 glycoside hydrolase family 130 protein [Clostridium guangxiense]